MLMFSIISCKYRLYYIRLEKPWSNIRRGAYLNCLNRILFYIQKTRKTIYSVNSKTCFIYGNEKNKSIKKGDMIVCRSSFDKKLKVSTCVVNEGFDTIILQSKEPDLCEKL
uniref:Transposase n=1 Tax=Caenorhabditis tropicalis TaxID=1561998 RepID=A0A1I7USN6_9PELO